MLIRIFALLACIMAIVASCSSDSPKAEITQSEWERVIAIRGEARDFLREITTDEFNRRTGQALSERSAILGRYAALASMENIELLQRVEDSFPAGVDERKFRRLRLFLIEARIQNALAAEQEYLDEMAVHELVAANGRKYTVAEAAAILSRSPDRLRREQLYAGLLPMLQRENAVRSRMLEISDSALFHFGYGSILSFIESKLEVDYAALVEQARSFLQASDSLFNAVAVDLVPQLSGVQRANLRGHDEAYLMHADPAGRWFDPDSCSLRFAAALRALNFDPDTIASITIVSGSTPRNGQSTTFPISVPDDIRVMVADAGGSHYYREYFHELGHALAYLYSGERELELSQLDGVAVSEAAAFVIEDFLLVPAFLETQLAIPPEQARRYARFAAFQRLLQMRKLAADLLFEQVLYSEVESVKTEFERIHQPLLNYPWSDVDREMYLRSAPGEAAAEYLQGMWLAAQLRRFATDELGTEYYRHSDFGALLQKFWSHGRRFSAEQIAVELELGSLDFTAALDQIRLLCRP